MATTQFNTEYMTSEQQRCTLEKAQDYIKEKRGVDIQTWDIILYEWSASSIRRTSEFLLIHYKNPSDRRRREEVGLMKKVTPEEVTAYTRNKKLTLLGI